MNDEHRRIIIRKISSYEQQGNDPQGNSSSPVNRWVALVIMIPVLALLAVLGVFFFTIFVALFSIIAVIFATRIWWLRRKFRQRMQESGATPDDRQYDYTAQSDQSGRRDNVEDAEIIEETTVVRESKKASDNGRQ
ncbi:MAG: hypothetical protein KF908_01705 [Nitrosomonas sp.]|nr:hypothetical protein [Nitrosomonas sp.]MCW5606923.1 hypothetical protein [Nitrosomonas sp.]